MSGPADRDVRASVGSCPGSSWVYTRTAPGVPLHTGLGPVHLVSLLDFLSFFL